VSGLTRGRIIRGEAAERAVPILRGGLGDEQRARMSREEVEAHQNADRIVHLALTRSESILASAKADAERVAREASQQAAEAEQARLAAAWLAFREHEEKRAARDLDRSVAIAKVLAERLIGRELELDSTLIASIAREALAESRGARRVRLEANPRDAEGLRSELVGAGLGSPEGVAIEVIENAELARGSLRVHTELGTVDARLHPRLERLAAALRDALEPA
jgi:flagellar biosynthesis/type III secretory pathway protein FliH